MAFGHDAALDLSLRDVARDNVRVPAVLGLRPALSPTRSLRRLESSVVIDVGPIRSVRVTGSTFADRSTQPFPGRSPASPRGQDNVRSPRASQLGHCPENGIPWEWREAGWRADCQ